MTDVSKSYKSALKNAIPFTTGIQFPSASSGFKITKQFGSKDIYENIPSFSLIYDNNNYNYISPDVITSWTTSNSIAGVSYNDANGEITIDGATYPGTWNIFYRITFKNTDKTGNVQRTVFIERNGSGIYALTQQDTTTNSPLQSTYITHLTVSTTFTINGGIFNGSSDNMGVIAYGTVIIFKY